MGGVLEGRRFMSGRDIEEFIKNARRLLKYATKPGRQEIYQISKIIFLSIISIGILGFILKMIFNTIIGG